MKKLFLLTMAFCMSVSMMAIGRNDGSTKANAIDFDWDRGIEHTGGTKWYRVDLKLLYEEENPTLTLYLTNPSNEVNTSVDVSMKATVAGQSEEKNYTIAARQYKAYTANAMMLVRMKQTEIYLTLTSNGRIKLSAKVFEAADLDETCKDARTLSWDVESTQEPTYSAWWKVSLSPIKNTTNQDAKITITNTGSKTVNLKVGQSLDCPSSGVTKRIFTLAPGERIYDTIPRSMIASVQPDELYFGVENIESKVSIKVEKVAQPPVPVIGATDPFTVLHVTDTIESLPSGATLYRIKVADMNSLNKYEPEFTYRNVGETNAKVTVKMAFEVPAFGTSNAEYNLAPGEEEIVVYKKNMLEGLGEVEYIYLLTIVEGSDVNFYGRFKHVREGKACKTNIDFNWESGHTQESRTTQWYAIPLENPRDQLQDIIVHVKNQGTASAKIKASMAFSCPYVDLQEISRTLAVNKQVDHRLPYSSYAMMSDTVWIGLETDQELHFWAETEEAVVNPDPDTICLHADTFDWKEGVLQHAGDTVWYWVNMEEVREESAKFPTVFIQNMSSTKAAKITAELSLECPDEIANEKRSLTIAANGSWSQKLSRNLFENIVQDEIYVRVISTQDVALQVRLSEESEGSTCASAVPFNWTSGNSQAADADLWYKIDLHDVLTSKEDVRFKIANKDNKEGEAIWQVSYACPDVEAPSVEKFTIGARGAKYILEQYASLKYLPLPDSAIYVHVQGTTGLHLSAERIEPGQFDPIEREGLVIDTIALDGDALISQTTDTLWWCVTHEEILEVRDILGHDAKTVELDFENPGNETVDVKVEIAYTFPITERMQTITVTVPAGSSASYIMNWKKFAHQINNQDSIFVRVTIPSGTGILYKSTLVDAFDGATREEAVPIVLGKSYAQSPMTERWYKVNMADLKYDKNLYDKVLHVSAKNAGKGKADVNVAVYDGLLSQEDLLYGYLTDKTKTLKKGQKKSRDIPAQMVYGLGEMELYIWVRTTDSLLFETRFKGTYAAITDSAKIDSTQFQAKLVVPNVDYVLPADTTMWYMVCIPYIRNNYKYVDNTTLDYQVEGKGPLRIEVLTTFQDTMLCRMPVYKRTTKKKIRKGSKPLREILDRAIKEVSSDFGFPELPEEETDSLLRRFFTSDSVTAYLRVRSNKTIHLRLNTPQVMGVNADTCASPMEFDWEHGNVNPAGQETWYHVQLDSMRVPKGYDLRLHVDNWGSEVANTVAGVKFECADPASTKTYSIEPGESAFIDVDRDLLVGEGEEGFGLGWPDMLIDYQSDQVTHLWAELVSELPRDTLRKTITAYVCYNETYLDTIMMEETKPITHTITWNDTVPFQDGVTMKDSLTTFVVHPLLLPQALTGPEIKNLQAAPLTVQGMQLFVDSSNAKLTEYYKILSDTVDTIVPIDTVYWAKPVYDNEGLLVDTTEEALDLNSFYQKTDRTVALLLVIKSKDVCRNFVSRTEVVFILDDYKTVTKPDAYICESDIPTPNPYIKTSLITFDTLGMSLSRYVDTVVMYKPLVQPELYSTDEVAKPVVRSGESINVKNSVNWLINQFEDDKNDTTMAVTSVKWQVLVDDAWQDLPYAVSATDTLVAMRYGIQTECATDYLYSEDTLYYTLSPTCVPTDSAISVTRCEPFTWYEHTCEASGDYVHTFVHGNAAGCDSVLTMHFTLQNQTDTVKEEVETCNRYLWRQFAEPFIASGMYYDTIRTVYGCDSVIYQLNLVLGNPYQIDLPIVAKFDDRVLFINRKQINEMDGWYLDLVDDMSLVHWFYRPTQLDTMEYVGYGYYLTTKDGSRLKAGFYHAEIELPAVEGEHCGVQGATGEYEVKGSRQAPALIPNYARPEEDIRVINLDPEQETQIRIYSTEGLVQRTYTVRGEESCVIKAAAEHGFYLVELVSEHEKVTLRYIVK